MQSLQDCAVNSYRTSYFVLRFYDLYQACITYSTHSEWLYSLLKLKYKNHIFLWVNILIQTIYLNTFSYPLLQEECHVLKLLPLARQHQRSGALFILKINNKQTIINYSI